jgi:DNA sulfur modification protein DndC
VRLQLSLFPPPEPAFPAGEPAWAAAFSGGKDSTVLAFLALDAAARLDPPPRLAVVYGDTGVEIPPLRDRALRTLAVLRKEAAVLGVPLEAAVAAPPPGRGFWFWWAERGYAFSPEAWARMPVRWCRDRLKAKPVAAILKALGHPALLLGTRAGESRERAKALAAGTRKGAWHPLAGWDAAAVWECLLRRRPDIAEELAALYGHPDARTGCWVCPARAAGEQLRRLARLPGWEWLEELASLRERVLAARGPEEREAVRRAWEELAGRRLREVAVDGG